MKSYRLLLRGKYAGKNRVIFASGNLNEGGVYEAGHGVLMLLFRQTQQGMLGGGEAMENHTNDFPLCWFLFPLILEFIFLSHFLIAKCYLFI